MITYEEFLRTAAVPRTTIDRFLDEDQPTWARYDGEVGYTLGQYMPRDGIDGSWTISTAEPEQPRTSWVYAGRPCRLNTYGNSFTQCHQVSDGETWQEYLAGHLGEPVRNYGMGGFGTYQAYRRMRRNEPGVQGAPYVILYIWGDDHCRSVMRSRHAATHRVWDDQNGYLFHGNFWANVELDLESGAFVERDSLLPTRDELYRMCDPEFMVNALRDDLMVMLYGMARFEVEGDLERLERLSKGIGSPECFRAIVEAPDADQRANASRKLAQAYGFAASRYVVAQAAAFCRENGKELLTCLLCPTATDQLLRGETRYDQGFADHLRDEGYRVFDMNEVHLRDFRNFKLSVEDYRKRYWIGHYNPTGNHFFAYSLKDTIVDWLDPKPITYHGRAASSDDFAGYLPDSATS